MFQIRLQKKADSTVSTGCLKIASTKKKLVIGDGELKLSAKKILIKII
jgi:hypothetical protein